MINSDTLRDFAQSQNWAAVYHMLDHARDNAVLDEDIRSEVGWRIFALKQQQRYDEALDLLLEKAHVFNCRSYAQHQFARLFVLLHRDREAVDALSAAPFDDEMSAFYGLAIDAKFFYFYLLAKSGDPSVKRRLSEIPDDYEYIMADGKLVSKRDIVALLA